MQNKKGMNVVKKMVVIKERSQTGSHKNRWVKPQILTIGNKVLAVHIKASAFSGGCGVAFGK